MWLEGLYKPFRARYLLPPRISDSMSSKRLVLPRYEFKPNHLFCVFFAVSRFARSGPLTRQRQIPRAFSTGNSVEILPRHVFKSCATYRFPDYRANQLCVCYNAETKRIVHQVPQVVLCDSAADSFFAAVSP